MVKYKYDVDDEVFKRIDKRGYSLKVNIMEARRIKSLMDLGNGPYDIMRKIEFTNNISITTLRTVMKNINEGNITLEGDYPAPTQQLKELDYDIRIRNLEKRVSLLELGNCDCECESDENQTTIMDKVKGWIPMRQ